MNLLDKDVVEIALAADRNYIIGLTVTAYSIACSCSQDAPLRFHLLYSGFTETDKNHIRTKILSVKDNCEILFYDVSKVDFSFFPKYAASRMTYARLILPRLLTKLKHVIYSDVDILWLDDVYQLWKLKDKIELVSCVKEQSNKTIDMEEAWFTSKGLKFDRSRYFCAGVSFYNLSSIRESNAFNLVYEFGRRFKTLNCADQSMMYGAIKDDVGLLPDRWQTFPRNGLRTRAGEPVVLHYAGEAPWKCTHYTKMITDTQLLWFKTCSIVYQESQWRSLRRFYSISEILLGRLIFICGFKIWPISALSKFILKKFGVENFNESLKARNRYLKPILIRTAQRSKADLSSAAI